MFFGEISFLLFLFVDTPKRNAVDGIPYDAFLACYFDKRMTFHENGLSSAVRVEPSTIGSGLI